MSLGLNNQKPVQDPASATTPPKPQPKPGMTLNEGLKPQPRPDRIVTTDNCLICGSGNAGQWICDTCIDSLKKSPHKRAPSGLLRLKCNACKQKRPCFAEFDMCDASRLPENCLFDKEKTPLWEDSEDQ